MGGNLGLSREYHKKLFGPLFYSWRNCPLTHVCPEFPAINAVSIYDTKTMKRSLNNAFCHKKVLIW